MDETDFENNQVYLDALPQVEEVHLLELEPPFLKVKMWTITIIFILLLLPIGYLSIFKWEETHQALPYIYIVWAIIMILSFVVSYYGFFVMGYAVRDKDIVFRKGLIWRSQIIIPFNRVQHCEVSQGPISRLMGMSELEVFTAGGTNSDMHIPGLLPDTANRIKDFILKQTALDEEE